MVVAVAKMNYAAEFVIVEYLAVGEEDTVDDDVDDVDAEKETVDS